ncbi:hypothetical protein GCM10010508_69560 [Streptomyces naganishii JCM 4654]|uniref:Uncharacterized protein n=1 Tax=Streptomyces naganishii JCM 4654 TaxID=1306179 RepID=A0A918YC24_9ACTN|nr:hypothetical protein GCM10010508_69560 [Streptomyces naganishii JCM 4654]
MPGSRKVPLGLDPFEKSRPRLRPAPPTASDLTTGSLTFVVRAAYGDHLSSSLEPRAPEQTEGPVGYWGHERLIGCWAIEPFH